MDLTDQVAIITGSAGGIGQSMARIFSENGAVVVINDINEAEGLKIEKALKDSGKMASFIKADISIREEAQRLVEKTLTLFDKIDILINNAGINIPMNLRGPIHEFPDEMWDKIISVDLDGVYNVSKVALQSMVQHQKGKIINIGSIVGAVPLRNQCAFAAAKAGVIQLTKAMAIELAAFGINVNAILPGSINIPAMNAEDGMYADGRYENIISHIPMNRPGAPEDIAYGALYLASDAASYVTGSVLVIDGGWTCGFARDW